jgi:two-component system, cell cycle response regulator DivK
MATILLVESTPANLALAHKLLRADHDVLTADTAEVGLDIARDRLPDLVLMGLGLADMNGWQALTKIRADPTTAGLRVVACTAHAMAEDHRRVLEAGFDGYLSLPIDFATFSQSVEELLP